MTEPSIPYGRQSIDESDVDAVVRVLRSRMLTQGPEVAAFERALAAAVGSSETVVVSSGTAALHALYAALGVGPGDDVVVPANTFVATAAAAVLAGARPVIADVDPETGNLDPDSLERALARCDRPRVVAAVHFAGRPCDLDGLADLAEAAGAVLVEDACHALGSRHAGGHPVGSHPRSRATVFSFHPVKAITTGEGGAVATDDVELAARLRALRHHAVLRDGDDDSADAGAAWRYQVAGLGFNYRITDLQCALGRSQLDRLETFVESRRSAAARYDAALAERFPELAPVGDAAEPGARSAYHLYVVRILGPVASARRRRRAVFDRLRADGIGVQVHYVPLHHHPFYRDRFGASADDLPGAEDHAGRGLTLPLFVGLTADEQARVLERLRAALDVTATA